MKHSEIKKHIQEGWIRVLFTMQVQGNDNKAVDKSLRKQIDELVKVGKEVETRISSPQLIEESKKWYSQYSEIDMLLTDPAKILDALLDYMVTSVEIIEPNEIVIKSKTHQNRLNDLALKFRETERAVLFLSAQNKMLQRELDELTENSKTKSIKKKKK